MRVTDNRHYRRWVSMKNRCLNSKCHRYKDYGGRGIKICADWLEFKNFAAWCEATFQEGKTLNRIDNDGDYSPSNCNWATASEQQINSRHDTPARISRTIKRCAAGKERLHRIYGDPDCRANKHCPKCRVYKSLDMFKPNKSARDLLDSMCRDCRRVYDNAYKKRQRAGIK